MKTKDLIQRIDTCVIKKTDPLTFTDYYKDFPLTASRLIKIRGKLLHSTKLSKNDLITLQSEGFI